MDGVCHSVISSKTLSALPSDPASLFWEIALKKHLQTGKYTHKSVSCGTVCGDKHWRNQHAVHSRLADHSTLQMEHYTAVKTVRTS